MFEEIAEGVFRRRYESLDLNVGAVVGDDGVLIVDTRQSPRLAREILEELSRVSSLPVRWVVNTHWHWDHVFGNDVFPGAEIWGHELCLTALAEHGEEMKKSVVDWVGEEHAKEIEAVEIVPPTHTFSEEASLQIGREVRLTYHGLAHTDADIVVRVSDASVAFYGDLIEQGAPPSFGDSSPVAWPVTLERAIVEPVETYVPGHGDTVDHDFVVAQMEELDEVARLSISFISGEIDLESGIASGPYPKESMRSALVRASAVA